MPINHPAAQDWLNLLNDAKVRTHLVGHETFDRSSLAVWLAQKQAIDAQAPYRIRAVVAATEAEESLAGWCGLQPGLTEDEGMAVDLAIVLAPRFWGLGRRIFGTLLTWAEALGHEEVSIHLLESRREYRGLRRMALSVESSEWAGRRFLTYRLPVRCFRG